MMLLSMCWSVLLKVDIAVPTAGWKTNLVVVVYRSRKDAATSARRAPVGRYPVKNHESIKHTTKQQQHQQQQQQSGKGHKTQQRKFRHHTDDAIGKLKEAAYVFPSI